MKTKGNVLALLLLSAMLASSCAATMPPPLTEQEEELSVEPFRDDEEAGKIHWREYEDSGDSEGD